VLQNWGKQVVAAQGEESRESNKELRNADIHEAGAAAEAKGPGKAGKVAEKERKRVHRSIGEGLRLVEGWGGGGKRKRELRPVWKEREKQS